jgi:hypothetical protein
LAIYSVNQDVVFREEDDGYGLAFEIPSERLVTFNPTGSRIWKLFDGKKNTETIIETLAAEYATKPMEIAEPVMKFIDSLSAIHYIFETEINNGK